MNQKERLEAGLPYKSWLDGLSEDRLACKTTLFEYNNTSPVEEEKRDKIIKGLLGKTGKNIHVESPFFCDYGYHIEIGENFYSNHNLVILDVGKIIIGKDVMFGPNVAIYSVGHPIHPQARNSGYEYGDGVTIGDNCWIGGNVVITPGVHIGNNVVIGAGSVVTKDIPDNTVAVGNPCRVVKEITDEDKKYYYKDRVFDVDDYIRE